MNGRQDSLGDIRILPGFLDVPLVKRYLDEFLLIVNIGLLRLILQDSTPSIIE